MGSMTALETAVEARITTLKGTVGPLKTEPDGTMTPVNEVHRGINLGAYSPIHSSLDDFTDDIELAFIVYGATRTKALANAEAIRDDLYTNQPLTVSGFQAASIHASEITERLELGLRGRSSAIRTGQAPTRMRSFQLLVTYRVHQT